MRIAWIGALLAVFALAASAGAAGTSGLAGVVRKGPITPVCVAERPCTAPAPGVTLVFSRGGRDRGRTASGAAGAYRVALSPGRYEVRALVQGRRGLVKPAAVVVPRGAVARMNFLLDTGIR